VLRIDSPFKMIPRLRESLAQEMSKFVWPLCPQCELSSSTMNAFITQRFDLAKRVEFKISLGNCPVCSDVYHREREFLVLASAELYPTKYEPPVNSEERLCLSDFLQFFQDETAENSPSSYAECFDHRIDLSSEDRGYVSDFPKDALGLVTRQRIVSALRELPKAERAVTLLYLMGVRSFAGLAEKLRCQEPVVGPLLFRGRRRLQAGVCGVSP